MTGRCITWEWSPDVSGKGNFALSWEMKDTVQGLFLFCRSNQCVQESIPFLPLCALHRPLLSGGSCLFAQRAPLPLTGNEHLQTGNANPGFSHRDSVNNSMHLVKTKWETKLHWAHFTSYTCPHCKAQGVKFLGSLAHQLKCVSMKTGHVSSELTSGGTWHFQQKGISRWLTWVSHDCCCSMQF